MSHGNKQQWILAKRPEGMPDSSEVVLQDAPIPETGAGMLLVKNHYISLDPCDSRLDV
jgi:NADPH-dependent curcumin reductase CurA